MAVSGRNAFPAAFRLRQSREFLRARNLGRKLHTAHFIIYLVAETEGPCRLGITASRKVGGAVQRNRVKRLLREFFRRHREDFPGSIDLSVIVKSGVAHLNYRQVCEELEFLLTATGA